MATIPQVEPKKRTVEELAVELHQLVEENFDAMELTPAERDARYDSLEESLNASDVVPARA